VSVIPPSTTATPARRPVRHRARWIAGLVLVVLVVVAIVAATRPSYQATAAPSPLLGKAAPRFAAADFAGARVSLADFRGHYLFVNFFASWCAPCQQEEPNLIDFAFEQHRSANGAKLLSVVYQDSDAAAERFVEQFGASWPAVPDPDGTIANAFGVTAPPVTFLISPTGVVVGDLVGPAQTWQLRDLLASARKSGGVQSDD
jgi:cytochrome c biogenesis protein CcmG/thiol:disulfide interchange protein DsbE